MDKRSGWLKMTATDVVKSRQEYTMVYDEVVSYSSEEWKRITEDVIRKFVIPTNPNQMFKMRKASSAGQKVYVKPPIGKKPDWL